MTENRVSKIDLTSPKAIAVEAAGLALAAWLYRSRILSKDDRPDEPARVPTPLGDVVGENSQVYVLWSPEKGDFEVGAEDDEHKFISVNGVATPAEEGAAQISIDSMSDEDLARIEILRNRMLSLYDKWKNRTDILRS